MDKIEAKIDVFMPYAREYFVGTYGPFSEEIIKLVEHELIPHYVDRLSEASFIQNIFVYSNDLKNENNLHSEKIKITRRAHQTERISERAQLVEALDKLALSSFVLLNPLFPLVSTRTIKKMYDEMTVGDANIFLGTPGNIYDNKNNPDIYHLDHGAVTVYRNLSQCSRWDAFSDFASIELLNIRKINDIELIKIIQNMGMQL